MARYARRRTTSRAPKRAYASRGRAAPRRTYAAPRRAAPRRTATRRAAPQTIRIVLEQPRMSDVARPGIPVGFNQMMADPKRTKPKL